MAASINADQMAIPVFAKSNPLNFGTSDLPTESRQNHSTQTQSFVRITTTVASKFKEDHLYLEAESNDSFRVGHTIIPAVVGGSCIFVLVVVVVALLLFKKRKSGRSHWGREVAFSPIDDSWQAPGPALPSDMCIVPFLDKRLLPNIERDDGSKVFTLNSQTKRGSSTLESGENSRTYTLTNLNESEPITIAGRAGSRMRRLDSGFFSFDCNDNESLRSEMSIEDKYLMLYDRCAIEDRDKLLQFLNRQDEMTTGAVLILNSVSVGLFGSSGGEIHLAKDENIKLNIPPGALETPQIVYIFVDTESAEDGTINLSPSIECGPDGLHFKKPVQLTFLHCAVDAELEPMIRNGGDTDWNYANNGSDAVITHADCRTVTLDVHHFTGFKLSVSRQHNNSSRMTNPSRIPIADDKRNCDEIGKTLSMKVFVKDDQLHLYFVPGYRSYTHKTIEEAEQKRGFVSTEPLWKDLIFRKSKGSIIIQGVDEAKGRLVFERSPMSIEKILNLQRWECVPYTAAATRDNVSRNNMTIKVFQIHDPENYTLFSVKLTQAAEVASCHPEESTGQPCEYDTACEHDETSQTSSIQVVQNKPKQHQRSASDVSVSVYHLVHMREKQNEPLQQNATAKLSKRNSGESGYVSDIVPVGVLKGPMSLENSEEEEEVARMEDGASVSLDLKSCLDTPLYTQSQLSS